VGKSNTMHQPLWRVRTMPQRYTQRCRPSMTTGSYAGPGPAKDFQRSRDSCWSMAVKRPLSFDRDTALGTVHAAGAARWTVPWAA
jgi:hypothetical protein